MFGNRYGFTFKRSAKSHFLTFWCFCWVSDPGCCQLPCPVIWAWALPSFNPRVDIPYPHLRNSVWTLSSISTMVMWYTDVGTIQFILLFKQNFSLRNVGSTYLSVLQWCGQLVKLLCSSRLCSACAVELRLVAFETVCSSIELFALLQRSSLGVGRLTVEVSGSHTWQVSSGKWSARCRGRCLHKIKQTQETNIHAVRGFRTCVPRNEADADLRLERHVTGIGLPCYETNLYWLNEVITASLVFISAFAHTW